MFGSSWFPFLPETPVTGGWLYVYSWTARVLLSILLLFIGAIISQSVVRQARRAMRSVSRRSAIQDSPLASMFESTEALRGTGLLTHVLYWTILLFFIALAGEVLGITFFSSLVSLFVSSLPALFSAAIVLSIGVVLGGVVERLVKQQFKRVAPAQAVLAGTMASSLTLGLFILMAFSELGIARNFIQILFAGFVFALSLAFGLAFGLGAKDLVGEMLSGMVNEEKLIRKSKKAK